MDNEIFVAVACHLKLSVRTEDNGCRWYMYAGEQTTPAHSVFELSDYVDGVIPERVAAHWEGFQSNNLKGHQLNGFSFEKWGDVKEMVKQDRYQLESRLRRKDGVFKFHYHGLRLFVNDEVREETLDITFGTLKNMIEEAKDQYPNKPFEISLEGHYDWWESYQHLFEGADYEPTDMYINIPLYNHKIK